MQRKLKPYYIFLKLHSVKNDHTIDNVSVAIGDTTVGRGEVMK